MRSAHVAVVGAQWGDEGKGKIVDLLSERFDVVARFQGGPNAGHTVKFEGKTYALHHVPSGVFRDAARIVIGNGTVIDLGRLLEELDGLAKSEISIAGRLYISDRAHVILPIMKQLDAMSEEGAGADKIGTTLRGIGPTYAAKAARWGVRMADLYDRDHLKERIQCMLDGSAGQRLRHAKIDPGPIDAMLDEVTADAERLREYVADTAMQLNDWVDEGKAILFEGAQGTMLDLDHGTYPFVTSSSTLVGGLCAGLGVAPTLVGGTLGVFKAYTTRVGAGPMPTELEDGPEGFGERLRKRGNEYGTTTGRPRRCGWFDGVAARYAHRVNRFDGACITLLDVLDTFEEIRVCTGYKIDGKSYPYFPAAVATARRAEPIYESFEGWNTDTTEARSWQELPAPARRYLERVGEIIGAEIAMVGVGPDRQQSIVRPGSWLDRYLAETLV